MKEVVAQKKWTYTLYRTDDALILSVVCGGAAMFNIDVQLTQQEEDEFKSNPNFLDTYAEKIRNNPKEFM
jgi:hypothetical protein